MSWDGKIFDKYRVELADGTPLKGKKYFVLRLDSDNPVEAARVAAAMRAYKSEPRNCDVGTAEEQFERWIAFCGRYDDDCTGCPCDVEADVSFTHCFANWAQMPYAQEGGAK